MKMKERMDQARALKEAHRHLLRKDMSEYSEPEDKHVFPAKIVIGSVVLAGLMLIGGCFFIKPAHAFSDEKIVNAIYLAEGGKNAKKPFGILTVKCNSYEDCRRICLRTVRNNRLRYIRDVRPNGEDYLSYLSRKYAPIGAGNDKTGLNRNWLKNVRLALLRKEDK